MQKTITLIAAVLLLVACKNDKKTEKSTSQKDTSTKVETKKEVALSTQQEQFLATTIAYFKQCKAESTNRNDCRNSISKMITEFYNIGDFRAKDGGFVIYDSIQPIVKKSNDWVKLGAASNQEVLEKAQQAANEGKATLAIDVSETYGQVAMIIPGKLTKSASWELQVPNAAALVNYDAKKSFMEKSLSYAFKSAENIVIYSKSQ
ncbi:hypothetical protein C8N46_105157 [Kordia periserrulae]|uniref:Lipoprotein n=1 Tax=Kordia periserrulae TaxID=701523 RepID=A0A2T6BY44_9FLAO|nr:hypothetical protein [Kordia periserrulae]PTX61001.1 hypothetical protein C8N46_105157 [Kordia periserrulae]